LADEMCRVCALLHLVPNFEAVDVNLQLGRSFVNFILPYMRASCSTRVVLYP
jgi:hypothetical protein